MAKLFTMFVILIAIQFCLILYTDSTPNNTTIWSFVTNLDQWNSTSFFSILGGLAAAAALVGIASGGTFRFVTDFLVMGPAILGLASIGFVFTQLAGVVRGFLVEKFFTSCLTAGCVLSDGSIKLACAQSCAPATLLTAVIVGPFALYYFWTVMEWWRGKDV